VACWYTGLNAEIARGFQFTATDKGFDITVDDVEVKFFIEL